MDRADGQVLGQLTEHTAYLRAVRLELGPACDKLMPSGQDLQRQQGQRKDTPQVAGVRGQE